MKKKLLPLAIILSLAATVSFPALSSTAKYISQNSPIERTKLFSDSTDQKNRELVRSELYKIFPQGNNKQRGIISDIAAQLVQEQLAEMLYQFAFSRDGKFVWDLFSNRPSSGEASPAPYQNIVDEGEKWIKSFKKQNRYQTVYNWGLLSFTNLHAYYIPSGNSEKTVILHHGYRGNPEQFGAITKVLYENGYNVLLPSSRATGKSGGNTITFGWREKNDLKGWINNVNAKKKNGEIILVGVSMGAAVVMMASGMDLPKNVKAVVEDCGYTSLYDQLEHLHGIVNVYAQEINITIPKSVLGIIDKKLKKRQKFSLKEASAINQLKKSSLPTMFIHGTGDRFVPWEMLKPLQAANPKITKDVLEVIDAGHAESISYDYPEYVARMLGFISQYTSK